MSQTLYRKYRPLRFADLVGQDHIRRTLANAVATDQLAHAFVLTGPRGVGKTTTARVVARAVNCTGRKKGESEPDNTCDACVSILEGRALDVIEVDAASQTGVDNVRENIIANARVAPGALKYKVFIIDEVHMLSIGAFNALLKLLEEPPAHALFLLATTEIHKVPETILSRCQRFDFRRVSLEALQTRIQLVAKAEGVKVDDDVADEIARRAEGSVRDADSLLGQLIGLGEKHLTMTVASVVLPRTDRELVLKFVHTLLARDRVGAIDQLHGLVDDGVDLTVFVQHLTDVLRTAMLVKLNPAAVRHSGVVLDTAQLKKLSAAVAGAELNDITAALAAVHGLARDVKNDPVPHLPLEIAIVQLLADAPVSAAPQLAEAPPTPQPVSTKPGKTAAKKRIEPAVEKASESPVTPGEPSASTTAGIVSTDQVTAVWEQLIQEMKKVNHGSAMFLKTSVPVDVNDGTVLIGVRFPFHAERLMEVKNKRQLEDALSGLLGVSVRVKLSVGAPLTNPAPTTASSLDDLAKAFGGEVL